MIRNIPRDAAVYGVDLGKNVFFHVVGLDSPGAVVQRVKFRRDTLLPSSGGRTALSLAWKHAPARSDWHASSSPWAIRSASSRRSS